jgi:hypothetical protein
MTFHTLRQDTESHAMFMASGDPPKAAFFRQDAIVIACEEPFSLNRKQCNPGATFYDSHIHGGHGWGRAARAAIQRYRTGGNPTGTIRRATESADQKINLAQGE